MAGTVFCNNVYTYVYHNNHFLNVAIHNGRQIYPQTYHEKPYPQAKHSNQPSHHAAYVLNICNPKKFWKAYKAMNKEYTSISTSVQGGTEAHTERKYLIFYNIPAGTEQQVIIQLL